MEIAPEFMPKAISLNSARKLNKLKIKASELLKEIEQIDISNENVRMVMIARTKLEEIILWSTKAYSRAPEERKLNGGDWE